MTPAEGEVYEFLLAESPATGYRIAQGIGRPVGNVYKAVESLEAKGAAVVADEEDHRVARAVPVEHFSAGVRDRVARACEAARHAAGAGAEREEFDDRVYRLSSMAQFEGVARSMLDQATMFVAAMGAPMGVERIADSLVLAAARGVPVAIKTLAPIELTGVRVIVDARGESALANAPGHWLTLNADGGQHIDVMIDPDAGEILTGYWTRHPLLAWTAYTGVYSRLVLEDLRSAGELAGLSRDRGQAWSDFEVPLSKGKRLMVERFRSPSPGSRRVRRSERGERP